MNALPTPLRRLLEKQVIAARNAATKGAMASLTAIAVGEADVPASLTGERRKLRNVLRAEARRLDDALERDKTNPFPALAAEVAYAQWHRLLFARFLAENDLLMHPEANVPVSLEDCADIAKDEGKADAWAVASEYAARMLPGIFPNDDPLLQLRFALNDMQALEAILNELPREVFLTDDSLGWVYQFWQTERKTEVNKSGRKIGGADISPVTQLFTEHYMVQFLLHNSLGAWWASRHPGDALPTELSYLRYAEGDALTPGCLPGASPEDGRGGAITEPASSEDSPSSVTPLPSSGEAPGRQPGVRAGNEVRAGAPSYSASHPAAGAFPGWPDRAADLKVLDPCCGSGHFLVAALALLRRFRMIEEGLSEAEAGDAVLRDNLFGLELDPRCTQLAVFAVCIAAWKAGGYRPLPLPHIACSGLAVGQRLEEWTNLAKGDTDLEQTLRNLYHLFENAPDLGSLIDPARAAASENMYSISWERVEPLLEKALAKEKDSDDPGAAVFGTAAKGVLRAAQLLAGKYTLVVTNVPYLARGKQGDVLRTFAERTYSDAKADLATVFVRRCLDFCAPGGSTALVTPQNWLFLGSYASLRGYLLRQKSWNLVARLGFAAFSTPMFDFNVMMVMLTNAAPQTRHDFAGIDASERRTPAEKDVLLRTGEAKTLRQSSQLMNPDARIALETFESGKLLEAYADSVQGLATSDDPQFILCYWEMPRLVAGWEPLIVTVEETTNYTGRESILHWEDGRGRYFRHALALKDLGKLGGWKSGTEARGKRGVSVRQMRDLPCTMFEGEFFHQNAAAIVPKDPKHLPAIWAFCSSPEFHAAVRRIDQALKVTNASLVKVPFDLEQWQKVAQEQYPDGLPEPYSDDPTQWLFHGHPARAQQAAPLHVAVARLLGYRWPEHGLPPTPDGKPRQDTDGLSALADTDGIVCLPSVAGEKPAAQRLRALLAAAYSQDGVEWTPALEQSLIVDAAASGKTAHANLEEWLRDGFFAGHCRLFHNRPFLWHLWDGEKDGFHVLVNYHRLDRAALDRLTYTYLNDWIERQREADRNAVAGAGRLLKAALLLQEKLKLIAHGECAPDRKSGYDIYIRWKPLHKQPLGWEPDLNDGVRLNIRPFVEAGILRSKFTLNWNKDRGADPTPNLSGTTDRLNDLHIPRAEKEAARKNAPPEPKASATKKKNDGRLAL